MTVIEQEKHDVRYCTLCGTMLIPNGDWRNRHYSPTTGELSSRARFYKCPNIKFMNLREHTKSRLSHFDMETDEDYYRWGDWHPDRYAYPM